MSNKVLIIGDPLKGGQKRNIDSVYLVFDPIANELNCKVDKYKSSTNKLEYTETQWVQKWCQDQEDYDQVLIKKIKDVDIVIGFELQDKHIQYLKKKNKKWVNLSISPIRFLNDLCFTIKSDYINLDKLQSISEYEIKYYANLMIQESVKTDIKPNSCVLFGQTEFDSSIYYNGKFYTLLDFKDSIVNISQKYSHIYFKPHPYCNNNNITNEIVETFRAELTYLNTYDILACENVAEVISVSSSVCKEAQYFQKASSIFLPQNNNEPYYNLGKIITDQNFWQNLVTQKRIELNSFSLPDNFFRKLFCSWSYNTIDDKFINVHDKINLNLESINSLNENIYTLSRNYESTIEKIDNFKSEIETLNIHNETTKKDITKIRDFSKKIVSFTITKKNQLDLNLNHLNKLTVDNVKQIGELYSYNLKQTEELNQKLNLINIDLSKNNIRFLKSVNHLHHTNRKLNDLLSYIIEFKLNISKMHNKQLKDNKQYRQRPKNKLRTLIKVFFSFIKSTN